MDNANADAKFTFKSVDKLIYRRATLFGPVDKLKSDIFNELGVSCQLGLRLAHRKIFRSPEIPDMTADHHKQKNERQQNKKPFELPGLLSRFFAGHSSRSPVSSAIGIDRGYVA